MNKWLSVMNKVGWNIVPAAFWRTVWKDRNSRCSEDTASVIQKIQKNCILFLVFGGKLNILMTSIRFYRFVRRVRIVSWFFVVNTFWLPALSWCWRFIWHTGICYLLQKKKKKKKTVALNWVNLSLLIRITNEKHHLQLSIIGYTRCCLY